MDQFEQRCDISEFKIRRGNDRIELHATSIDPGNRNAERFAANHVGVLRLTAVQDPAS